MPIRKGDGTVIDSVRLGGGTQISEIRKGDGTVLWSSGTDVPESADLQARYDFSQEDGALPVTDQTGNGLDLDAGQYTGVGESINGVQAGDFDGVDDQINDSSDTTVSQAHTVAIVYRLRSTVSNQYIIADNNGGYGYYHHDSGTNDDYWYWAGQFNVGGGTADTNTHIAAWMFDSSNSIARFDGSQVASGNAGGGGIDGVRIGANDLNTEYADMVIGEVLIYNKDKIAKIEDIESYLADKWGLSL